MSALHASLPETSFAERLVGDIAVSLPGATAVFRRFGLDFCCGGRISLAEAAARDGLDLAEIEGALKALTPEEAPVPEATDPMIDRILSRYHDTHRRELPELEMLARRVEQVHGKNPEVPHGLADLILEINGELGAHMFKEEQMLFPLMRSGGHPMIAHPIGAMRMEHDDHGEHLRALVSLTHDFTPPEGACGTWRALYAGLEKFATDLTEHIHLENNVLFPRFGA